MKTAARYRVTVVCSKKGCPGQRAHDINVPVGTEPTAHPCLYCQQTNLHELH